MESQARNLGAGDRIEVRALKSDGTVYRSWQATVESHSEDLLVTINRVGEPVLGWAGGWSMKYLQRTVYWFDRPYNLGELYEPNGKFKQIYIHIASPAALKGETLEYTDYELDVVRRSGEDVVVRDEDEFSQARLDYGYSEELCAVCREAVEQAISLARHWRPAGPPRFSLP